MQFDPVLLAARMQAMKSLHLWRDQTIVTFMEQALRDCPDKTAVIAYRSDAEAPERLSYRELDRRAERLARNLAALGIGHADVVTFQLPNGWAFITLALACARLGAVANPVMPIFRQHELDFMLNFGESKVFVVPKMFRGFDYETMARGMLPRLPHLRQLIVLGGDGEGSFEQMLLERRAPPLSGPGLAANDVMLLMYTSGTTGEPKAVMHTSNTLFSNLHAYIDVMQLSSADIVLGASPMAHLTGYGYLAMIPLLLNATVASIDIWDPKRALQIVRDEAVTFSMASSAFVADLCLAVENGAATSPTFTKFNCAGAPIPPVLIERAWRTMGLRVSSAWGMTECGAVTVTEPARALEKSGVSDGRPLPGMELKIVDAEDKPLPAGQAGMLKIRGASLFGGYLKRPHLNATTEDGWFDTGDLALIDAEGYLRITGRSKDLIIRGGENLPVMEIENLLYRHPAIRTCAVVGFPDPRLGERACAFVTLKPGQAFSMQAMQDYFAGQQVTRQYCPERLEILEELPATPSGKLQKFKLREMARECGHKA